MNETKCRRRTSSRKYRISSDSSTHCKLTTKNSSCNDSSEGEIEFEGWIEFITKNNKNEKDKTLRTSRKSCRNKASTRNISNSQNENNIKYKDEKKSKSIKKENKENTKNRNEENSDNSYSDTKFLYKQPDVITSNNFVQVIDNGESKLFINGQGNRENSVNSLNPIYVDPIAPIVLKNQQLFPQLYIRQPPTVIVTNEQRPPLVINPPPANVIFKNQPPQPIYVNNARPNIIIKNDLPVLQHPINMDTVPIQVEKNNGNISGRKSFLKFSCSKNPKGEPEYNNKNYFLDTQINAHGTMMPTNFVQLDNQFGGDIAHQALQNVYVVNDNQQPNFFQTQNAFSTLNPNNNVIHIQQNPVVNEREANGIQNVRSPYIQVNANQNQNGNLLNQQVIGNPLIQTIPQTQNFEAFNNIKTPVTYANQYEPQVTQATVANGNPQVIYQSPHLAPTIVQEQESNNPVTQFQTVIPNNGVAPAQNIVRFQNAPVPEQLNVCKPVSYPVYPSTQVLSPYPTINCIPSPKVVQVTSLRKNSYINPNLNNTPKKIQIIARPMQDVGLKGFNTCR